MVKFTEADRHVIEVSISGGIITGEPLVAAINNLLDDYEMLKAACSPVSEAETITSTQYPIKTRMYLEVALRALSMLGVRIDFKPEDPNA